MADEGAEGIERAMVQKIRRRYGRVVPLTTVLASLSEVSDTSEDLFKLLTRCLYHQPAEPGQRRIAEIFRCGQTAVVCFRKMNMASPPPFETKQSATAWFRRHHHTGPVQWDDSLVPWLNGRLAFISRATPPAVFAPLHSFRDLYLRAEQDADQHPEVLATQRRLNEAGAVGDRVRTEMDLVNLRREVRHRAVHRLVRFAGSPVALI
jgi:hypothetical protein